jgi:hypothetical protein
MERSLAKAIRESEDVASGLQVFEDRIRRSDTNNIGGCISEILMLRRGLEDLQLTVVRLVRLPVQLEDDIRLLLKSFRLSLTRIELMFGETRATKLDGKIPYAHIWHGYCKDLKENEDAVMLLPRLELYSVFLKAILQCMAG